jgi:hypothetical protein
VHKVSDLETSNCFFHYTTREAAFEHILPTGQLRFSTYEQMRDPIEKKDWSWTGVWPVDNPDFDAEDPLEEAFFYFHALARQIRQQAHLLALTIDADSYPTRAEQFAKGWARARMWEQYGENHAGVCLIFDRGRLTTNLADDLHRQLDVRPYHRRVDYDEAGTAMIEATRLKPGSWPVEIDPEFVASYIDSHNDELFFRKTLDWQAEYEYRFVTTASPDQPLFARYGDALVGILVGERFPDWQRPAALEASRAVDIEPAIMDWRATSPKPARITRRSKAERQEFEASYRKRPPTEPSRFPSS